MLFLDSFFNTVKKHFDDDSADRLNYYWTPRILIFFSLTLSAKQYVGQPIQCWIPAQFTGAWEQYSENYCFVQNTYFVRPDAHIPDSSSSREEQELGYYQWVPFILGLQAILFYMPSLLWRALNWQSGVAVKSLVSMARSASDSQSDKRNSAVQTVAAHIHDSLDVQKKLKQFSGLMSLAHRGAYLSTLYLAVKVIYLFQIICQFLILNRFLSTNYTLWGFGILSDLLQGHEWQESGHFPRVTMCDFEVRVLGNKHRHTVQCVLMINMFNEKVYLFVWFWLVAVGIYTLGSLVYWFVHLLSEERQCAFIGRFLKARGVISDDNMSDARVLSKFVRKGLRRDGILISHLISKNAGDIIGTDLICNLWKRFLDDEAKESPNLKHGLDDVDGFHEKSPLN